MSKLILGRLHLLLFFDENNFRFLFRLWDLLRYITLNLFGLLFLNIFCIFIKAMPYAILDDLYKFLNIEDIVRCNSFSLVLFLYIFLYICFEMIKEILIDFIITKIKDIFDSLFHLIDI